MSLSRPRYRSLSVAAAVWGVVFAAGHFYWAAGGEGAIGGDGDLSVGASLYIAFIAVLGLLSAAVALGLDRPWGTRAGRRLLAVLARTGSISLGAGVAVGVGRWIADGSLGDDGAGGVMITAYFLLGAVLFALLGWGRRARRGRTPTSRTGRAEPATEH